MAQQYLEKDEVDDYGGVCLLLQNLFIFMSSMLFKFGRAGNGSY